MGEEGRNARKKLCEATKISYGNAIEVGYEVAQFIAQSCRPITDVDVAKECIMITIQKLSLNRNKGNILLKCISSYLMFVVSVLPLELVGGS